MLNHTYTSVKNANLVDCGKKQHIPSQPLPLIRDNFLGEYRTELEKKKVLANLGVATDLSLEWEYIKGDIGRSESLMSELDSRTKYISKIDGFQKSVIDGIKYLETLTGEGEELQNSRLDTLEESSKELSESLNSLKTYISETVDVNIETLSKNLEEVTEKVNNITDLIKVSAKSDNALLLISDSETPGLYVKDLSVEVTTASQNIEGLRTDVNTILDNYITKEDLGGESFDFVELLEFNQYVQQTDSKIETIDKELEKTVKTGEDGHVDTLYVNTISKNNDDGNIKITDSFEVENGIPLDVRFVRETLNDLYNLPAVKCYPGMGVIVSSLSSLYILKKPADGIIINLDYISNPNNWKCPEDLVTVALTRDEYENLEEINPEVFYYIYEDEIIRTQEPKRENFSSEEEYNSALLEWIDSLKVLSQEYMSASWGVDIENKLSQKASNETVAILVLEINDIKGNESGVSLSSLNLKVEELQNESETITNKVDEIIVKTNDVEQEIEDVKDSLDEYVTKEYIQDSSNNFIFVKNEDYQSDKDSFEKALASELNTSKIYLDETIIISENGRLKQNNSIIANIEDVPKIEVMSQTDYDDLLEKEADVFYYTFDGDAYVTQNELTTKLTILQSQIDILLNRITVLENTLTDLQTNSNT